MLRLSLTRMAAAVGGLTIALTAGAGIASADPMDAIINTTCNYGQVMAELKGTGPGAARQFNTSSMFQGYRRSFLAAPPPKRQQMAQQIQAYPQAAQYVGLVTQ